jgi:excisionase family DNA binding protein
MGRPSLQHSSLALANDFLYNTAGPVHLTRIAILAPLPISLSRESIPLHQRIRTGRSNGCEHALSEAEGNDDTLSSTEASRLLGVSRTTLAWAKQGRFPGYRFGPRGVYRFKERDILAYLQRSRIPMMVEQQDPRFLRRSGSLLKRLGEQRND